MTGANSNDAVANAARVQDMIEAAANDGRPAVVHFPGLNGRYLINRTLTVPVGSDLVLTGDGAWTRLEWSGQSGQPLLQVDAASIESLDIRDLQFYGAGVEVSGLDAAKQDVLISRLRVAEAGEAAISIEGLSTTTVEIVESQFNGGLIDGRIRCGYSNPW